MDSEDQGASGRDPDEDWGDAVEGDGLRGWIPPDDRLWRHPSEAGGSAALRAQPAAPALRSRPGPWIVGGAASFVVVALVAAGVVMATTTGSQSGTDPVPTLTSLAVEPTTDPGAGRLPIPAIASMVSSIRPSTVAIQVRGATGTTVTGGLVVESGGIIVTASEPLVAAHSMTVIEPDGSRQTAELVGADRVTGLAVVRIADDLPAATFDAIDPSVGSMAVATALEPQSRTDGPPASLVYAGTVVSTGQAVGDTTAFSATAVEAPLTRSDLGCPLLDRDGHVMGMLGWTEGNGSSSRAVFLPAELVLGVSRQLVASGTVDHGWLGIESNDAVPATPAGGTVVTSTSTADGARLDAVDRDSPAEEAGLVVGDVVTGIDGQPVRSAAELNSQLYPDPPGTTLAITFERGGTTMTASVVLADDETDAPGDASSP